jgi:hypothetical protein
MAKVNYMAENKKLIDGLFAKDGSLEKNASAEKLQQWAQWYVRQDGFARRLMEPTPITDDDYVFTDRGRDPYIIRQITPKSAGAISTFWEAGSGGHYMEAGKYRIYIKRAATPNYTIDKIHLTAYRGDLITIFKDLSLMDLLRVEDFETVALSEDCALNSSETFARLGVNKTINLGPTVSTEGFTNALAGMTYAKDLGLSPATCAIHRSMWFELMAKMSASTHTEQWMEAALVGDTAKFENSLLGVKWLSVLDPDLIAPKEVFIYAPTENLGDFVTYQDARMSTKVEEDQWLTFGANQYTGMNFANPDAVFKATFNAGEVQDWVTEVK